MAGRRGASKTKISGTDSEVAPVTNILVTKEEVDAIVERAVKAAVTAMSADITLTFNNKLSQVQDSCNSALAENQQLVDQVTSLNTEVATVKYTIKAQAEKMDDQQKQMSNLQQELRKCLYPPPMIVRLRDREIRNEVISRRRQLKGTSLVIKEDLTFLNQTFLNRVRNHTDIETCWASHGEIFAISPGGKKVRLEPFDDISEKLAEADQPASGQPQEPDQSDQSDHGESDHE